MLTFGYANNMNFTDWYLARRRHLNALRTADEMLLRASVRLNEH